MTFAAQIPVTITQDQVAALLREAVGAARGAARGVASSSAWVLRATGAMIELIVDPRLATDPWQRTVLLASGAGLLNLKVLVKGLGLHPAVRLYPDPARRDLVATVRLEGQHLVTGQDRALVAAVVSGALGHPKELTADTDLLITALRRAARAEQAWLAVQPLSALPAAAPATSHDATTHDGNTGNQDGTALIVGTVLDGPGAQLHAGQAAQRVLLTAATQGMAVTAAMPDVLDAQTPRRAVRDLIGGGLWPQAVLHLDSNLPHPMPRAVTPAEPARRSG